MGNIYLYCWITLFGKSQKFNLDNPFDLSRVDKLDDIRIDFSFKHCPLNSVLLIDNGSFIEIHLYPYTKNYWTMSETDWWRFTNYLEENLELSEMRDNKINEILGDTKPYKNLIRQLGFIVSEERNNTNYFFDSVWIYYKSKGYISQKQAESLMRSIWS